MPGVQPVLLPGLRQRPPRDVRRVRQGETIKPTDPCDTREFIARARKQCRLTIRITYTGRWLAEALRRLEATIPEPGFFDGGPCCPACGVPFAQHPGLILTCRALQEARK